MDKELVRKIQFWGEEVAKTSSALRKLHQTKGTRKSQIEYGYDRLHADISMLQACISRLEKE